MCGKRARVSRARLLCLKLLTRHTIKPGPRQTDIQRVDKQTSAQRTEMSHIKQSRNALVQYVPPRAFLGEMISLMLAYLICRPQNL